MRRPNPVREKLANGRMVISAMLRLPDPSAAEIMAASGVDMICVDNEHYPFDPETVLDIVKAVQVHGKSCFVRLPDAEPARIAQYLDFGLAGIKIPRVESYEQAVGIVKAVKYATAGNRGFCPITRAANYGYGQTAVQFVEEANAETLVALMVETKTGLENLDKILTIPEVDIIAIGPSDVAASYGLPGRHDHPEVAKAIAEAQAKVIRSGKSLCCQCNTAEGALAELRRGVRLLLVGSDVQAMAYGFRDLVAQVKANACPE